MSPQLARAAATAREMLVDQGLINSTALVQILGRCLGVRACQLRHGLIDPAVFKLEVRINGELKQQRQA